MTSADIPPPEQIEAYRRVNAIVMDYYERQMASARAYSTLITGIGYAALIALWTGARNHLGPTTAFLTGALVGVSVFVFVLFEISKVSATQAQELAFFEGVEEFYNSPDFGLRMQERHAAIVGRSAAVNRAQPYVFWSSSVTGFGAALWIIGAMVAEGLRLWGSC